MAAIEADAKAPKRAPSAYWIWLSEHREDVVKALGGTKKGSEVSKKAGEMWKAMSEAEQAPYQQKAKEAKEAFEANRPQKEPKVKDEENLRKKPMTPVFAFINERRAEIAAMPGVKGLGDISKKGTELFKALPEAEQAERQKRYEEEVKSYKEWQQTDEGQAAMAGKKSATAEKRAAKKEKAAKKEAKLARKEGRTAKAAEDEPMAGDEREAKAKAKAKGKGKAKAKAESSAKRGRSESAGAAKEKLVAKSARGRGPSAGRGRGRGAKAVAAQAAEPKIDAKVLKEASTLGFESSLKNLAGRKDVAESGKSSKELLEALKNSNGLVNPAKRALLGA